MKDIDFSKARISKEEKNALLIKNVADRPNAQSSFGMAKKDSNATKDIFDRQFEKVVDKHEALIDKVEELKTDMTMTVDEIDKTLKDVTDNFEKLCDDIESGKVGGYKITEADYEAIAEIVKAGYVDGDEVSY